MDLCAGRCYLGVVRWLAGALMLLVLVAGARAVEPDDDAAAEDGAAVGSRLRAIEEATDPESADLEPVPLEPGHEIDEPDEGVSSGDLDDDPLPRRRVRTTTTLAPEAATGPDRPGGTVGSPSTSSRRRARERSAADDE